MASVRVGSAFGIPIRVGASFLLVVPLLTYLVGSQVVATVGALNALFGAGIDPSALSGGPLPWLLGLAAAVGLFGGVLLHELGHSLVARRYGLDIESITLWFLGGLARFVEFPDDWRQELTIAVAGPAVSAGLGAVFYAAFLALPAGLPATRFLVGYLAVLNLALAAFNLLPGFPMDGGRVLRALLARGRSRVRATRIAAAVGKAFAVALGVAGLVLGNVFWIAIAFFLYVAAASEARQAVVEAAFEGFTVADAMTPASGLATAAPGTTVQQLVEHMFDQRHTGYPVVADGRLAGIVTLEDVQEVDEGARGGIPVEWVMTTDLVTVRPDAPVPEAVTTMEREGVGRLLVTDEAGGLVGLLSRSDLMTLLQVARSRRSRETVGRPASG